METRKPLSTQGKVWLFNKNNVTGSGIVVDLYVYVGKKIHVTKKSKNHGTFKIA
jgi:hypothetical protein